MFFFCHKYDHIVKPVFNYIPHLAELYNVTAITYYVQDNSKTLPIYVDIFVIISDEIVIMYLSLSKFLIKEI